jgi:hypothetical protein
VLHIACALTRIVSTKISDICVCREGNTYCLDRKLCLDGPIQPLPTQQARFIAAARKYRWTLWFRNSSAPLRHMDSDPAVCGQVTEKSWTSVFFFVCHASCLLNFLAHFLLFFLFDPRFPPQSLNSNGIFHGWITRSCIYVSFSRLSCPGRHPKVMLVSFSC